MSRSADTTSGLLLVEDNPGDARLVKELLGEGRAREYEIDWVTDVSSARSRIAGRSYAAILLDLTLPDSARLDTVDAVCALAPRTAVVVLSGLTDEEIARGAIDRGAQDYLIKGQFDGALLERSIRYARHRKQAEVRVRESEERFRKMIHGAPDPISLYDLEARKYVELNAAWSAFTGIPRESALGRSAAELGFWADPGQTKRLFDRVQAEGLVHDFEAEFFFPAGQAFGSVSATTIEIDGRKVMVAWTRDVTIQRRAAEALRESEERFRSLTASSPTGIYLTDADGKCLYTNRRWQEMAGMTFTQSLGYGWGAAMHPDDRERVFAEWMRLTSAGSEVDLELRFQSPQGAIRWIHARASPVRGANGEVTGYVGANEDVTDRKAIEQMRRDLVRMLSHDIKNPLGAVLGFTELLRDTLHEGGDPSAEVDAIESNAHQALALALNFLDADRIEVGSLEPRRASCNLNAIAEHVLQQQAAQARRRRVELRAQLAGGLPELSLDRSLIERAFANLLANAIKFSPAKSIVTVSTDRSCDGVTIAVRDHGPGVPLANRERLFQRYARGDAGGESTGLGLFNVRTIIEAHHGTVRAEFPEDGGASFLIWLPVGAVEPPGGARR